MKKIIVFVFILIFLNVGSQETYKGLPQIRSSNKIADIKVDYTHRKADWIIDPEIALDIIQVPCISRIRSFGFYTDSDSIVFNVDGSTKVQFYVLLPDGRYALTEVQGYDYLPIKYDTTQQKTSYAFWYETSERNPYLKELRDRYPIDKVIEGSTSDSAKALRILKWVHDQWRHDGSNEPRKKDAISILEEVKEGKNFRCVEYGIVASAALNAVGLPARVLSLKTKNVETTQSGAGHVLLEVYLKDLKKWALLDGQWDVMPVLDGIPLNAVEFQQAIALHYDRLELRSLSGTHKDPYTEWIYPYLYYLDILFDNREVIESEKILQQGKPRLMLVPTGAKLPTVFQARLPINNVLFTSNLSDFYVAPNF